MSDIFDKIAAAVRSGNKEEMKKLASEVIENGVSPLDAIQKGGVVGLGQLGDDFENLEAYLPELMLGGETMRILINALTPHLASGENAFYGKVVIGTVKGDLHDIGKNLVATTLAVNGFNVIDLGVDISTNQFVEKAQEVEADIIAMSSLLTTSAYYMEDVIKRLALEGMKSIKVVVGGGPVDPKWAKIIGADAYARTAVGAVKVCKNLMSTDDFTEMLMAD